MLSKHFAMNNRKKGILNQCLTNPCPLSKKYADVTSQLIPSPPLIIPKLLSGKGSLGSRKGKIMREDLFISVLIEKLKNLKRDQEIRERLKDSIQEFKNSQAKILEKKPNYSSTFELKPILKEPKLKTLPDNRVACRSQSVLRQSKGIKLKVLPKETKRDDFTSVGYCINNNPVPYTTKVRGKRITLGHFKTLFNRKGDYRYFFKRYCNEFGTNVVFEEITDDEEVLPLWDGKIFALIEEIEEYRL
ncbi:axin-1 [Caerostris darwini]|uniref:Axin-1 n=1 Tax=Caerostris darwini TaxID=1538125 RepID=A0AAV4URC3_9ARAC|nr:axin-1 [Caerostris darwini]